MKSKTWVCGWIAIVIVGLFFIGYWVYKVDPYMHYHEPDTAEYYYELNNQRSQNDGITKHFKYNALITGTSMTENFKKSEVDRVFGVDSIKVSYSGGSYKEINDNLKIALETNSDLQTIIRGVDNELFFTSADYMRTDLGAYPTYLYDTNLINDVCYLFNKDVIFSRVYEMVKSSDSKKGITSFDEYSAWQKRYSFGINDVIDDKIIFNGWGNPIHLTEDEKKTIYENITKNVTSLSDEYPEVEFYYFFTPYSILKYKGSVENGLIYKKIEAKKYITELILQHENIKLFSFDGIEDIACDLNNYKDLVHYGTWVNSYIINSMSEGKHRVTKDNYNDLLNQELDFYLDYDYESLNVQNDYENDYYAAAMLRQALSGVKPQDLLETCENIELLNCAIISEDVGDVLCGQEENTKSSLQLEQDDYVKAVFHVNSINAYKYLVFDTKKITNDSCFASVDFYDYKGNLVSGEEWKYMANDQEWHQYVFEIPYGLNEISMVFNCGSIDSEGKIIQMFEYKDIKLY